MTTKCTAIRRKYNCEKFARRWVGGWPTSQAAQNDAWRVANICVGKLHILESLAAKQIRVPHFSFREARTTAACVGCVTPRGFVRCPTTHLESGMRSWNPKSQSARPGAHARVPSSELELDHGKTRHTLEVPRITCQHLIAKR